MALWHRIGPTRLGFLPHWYRRCYSLLAGAQATVRRRSAPLEVPLVSPLNRLLPSFSRTAVRFFAAPVQAKPKEDSASGPRLNEAITAAYVRVVTDEGHNIVSRREALDRARKLDLDLVEVQKTANPPVCKIMDFHREKFKQEEKEKEKAKNKSAVTLRSGENKEVRFKAKTELKDLKIKAETVTRLMERGYRVKCTALPTGNKEEDLGGLLARLLTLIEDVSVVESGPHLDAKQAYVIVRHIKFATKRSGKKISNVVDTVAKLVQGAIPNRTAAVANADPLEECPTESGETLDEVFESDSNGKHRKPELETKEETVAQSEPLNRYSKPSESKGRSQQTRPSEKSGHHGRFDPKQQQQIHPGNFNQQPPKIGDQSNLGKSNGRGLPGQRHESFNASKSEAKEEKKLRDATEAKPKRSYGIFSNSRTDASGNSESSRDGNTVKPCNPNPSPPRTFGIFSTVKTDSSSDRDASVGNH